MCKDFWQIIFSATGAQNLYKTHGFARIFANRKIWFPWLRGKHCVSKWFWGIFPFLPRSLPPVLVTQGLGMLYKMREAYNGSTVRACAHVLAPVARAGRMEVRDRGAPGPLPYQSAREFGCPPGGLALLGRVLFWMDFGVPGGNPECGLVCTVMSFAVRARGVGVRWGWV